MLKADNIAQELAEDYSLDDLYNLVPEDEAEAWKVSVEVMTDAIDTAIDLIEDRHNS